MMFWVAVLLGVVFAVLGIRKGFFVAWALLFNILISIYLSVMLAPVIIQMADIADSGYHCAICVAAIAVVAFTILQTIAITFFTGTFEVTFPKIVNKIGAGILGFISGYLIGIFIFLAVCITQFSECSFMQSLCGQGGLTAVAKPPIVKVCGFVGAASLQRDNDAARKIIDKLTAPAYEPWDNTYDETEEMEQEFQPAEPSATQRRDQL